MCTICELDRRLLHVDIVQDTLITAGQNVTISTEYILWTMSKIRGRVGCVGGSVGRGTLGAYVPIPAAGANHPPPSITRSGLVRLKQSVDRTNTINQSAESGHRQVPMRLSGNNHPNCTRGRPWQPAHPAQHRRSLGQN